MKMFVMFSFLFPDVMNLEPIKILSYFPLHVMGIYLF